MYSNKDLDIKYTNENILLNFDKKSKIKFNLNIIKNLNFGNFYNNLILLLKKNNTINLIKNYKYHDELYLYFNCYYIFYYYIVKKYIIMVKNGFYFNYKFEGIHLIDFFIGDNHNFIKIIKLLLKYRCKQKIKYHFRYVNLDYMSIKVIDINSYKIIKYLLKYKLINIKKKHIEQFNYYKQNNNSYYFRKILKYLKIDITKNDKIQKKPFYLLLTKKSLKIKKLFDKIPNFNFTPISFYKKNIYYKNIKFII